MGTKTGLVAWANGDVADVLRGLPELDRAATRQLAATLYADRIIDEIRDGSVGDNCYPPQDVVYVGCFPGLRIVADEGVMLDLPSQLPAAFIANKGRTYLHAMHSVVDWLAFGLWENGTLVRSLSVAPDEGIIEDVGDRLPFESPYWAGDHPATEDEDYPLPFHPLELGEEVLKAFFGFCFEGYPTDIEPCDVPLMGFRVKPRSA